MNLTSLVFNPTKDFKDFAESFRNSVLTDNALREYIKQKQGKNPENDTTPVTEDEALEALDSLGNELEAAGAADMSARIKNLAGALRSLKIVADNIGEEGVQKPEEETSLAAKNAWQQAAVFLDAMNGNSAEGEGISLLDAVKTYLKGGNHEDLEANDRDADDLYDAIQSNPAGKLLLRCGHLASDGITKGTLLQRKAMFGNFLYQDHELSKMDRQEEIAFFSEITDETKNLLLMSKEDREKKAGELAKEYAALQEQLLNVDIWLRNNPSAQSALDEFAASKEIQELYETEARNRAYKQTEDAAKEYRQAIDKRNEQNKDLNISINNFNKDVDRRQSNLERLKQEYEQKCKELEALIPAGMTQEEATKELNENTENPRLVNNRIAGTKLTLANQQKLVERLGKALEYPKIYGELQLSPEDQYKQDQLSSKQKLLDTMKQLRLKNGDFGARKGRGLNLTLSDENRTQVLKACTSLEKAYAAREKDMGDLLKKYQKAVSSLKPDDKELETKKKKLEDAYRVSSKELRAKHRDLINKSLQTVRSLADKGLADQSTVIFALAEGERLFPALRSSFGLGLFGPMGAKTLDSLIDNMQKETDREAASLRSYNPRYYDVKDFLESSAYLGSGSGDQQVRGYKDWSEQELQQALEEAQNGIRTVEAKLQDEENLLETNKKIYSDEEAKIKLLPTRKQVEDAKAALYSYRTEQKSVLDAEENGIPKKKENIRTFTSEELDKFAENRHLQMTESRAKELNAQVKRDLSFDVRKRFHAQNNMRSEFVKNARARMAAIDSALGHMDELTQENSPFTKFFNKRTENFQRNQEMLHTWEEQLTVPNPYPDQVKSRLEELCRQIDAGRKKGHNDTDLFKAMSGALTRARDFLTGDNGAENMDNLRRMNPETLASFRELLDEVNRSAAIYETERKKGIHLIPSNMHFVRLDLAKNLQNFALDTKAALTELETIEAQRPQECRDAIEAARNQQDAEPQPPKTLEEFIEDAYQLSRDPERTNKQRELNREIKEQEQASRNESKAIARRTLENKLENARNTRSGAAGDFTTQEKELNLMYNLERWGNEMDNMLASTSGNPDSVKHLRSLALNVRNLGNVSALTLEDNISRAKSGEDIHFEADNDRQVFLEKLFGMGEQLQELQAATSLFPENSTEALRFGYITRELIISCNEAVAQFNGMYPEAEPVEINYPVSAETNSEALNEYRKSHNILTGTLASGEVVELGWKMKQKENVTRDMLNQAADRSLQATETLTLAAAGLEKKINSNILPETTKTELDTMKSVIAEFKAENEKWNKSLEEYNRIPGRWEEISGEQALSDMEKLGQMAERALLPYAESGLIPEDNLSEEEQVIQNNQAKEDLAFLSEGLMQWGSFAREQLEALNPVNDVPKADSLQNIEEPEELKASEEEAKVNEAPAADNAAEEPKAEEPKKESSIEVKVPVEEPIVVDKGNPDFKARAESMAYACMNIRYTLDNIRDHLMNPEDEEQERPVETLSDSEKKQLTALDELNGKLDKFIDEYSIIEGDNLPADGNPEIPVQEMQEICRLAIKNVPVVLGAARIGDADLLKKTLVKLIDEGANSVSWLKEIKPDADIQAAELPEEILQDENNDMEQEKAEDQDAMEADQQSLLEEQQKLEAAKKELEAEERRLAEEQAARQAENEKAMNVLRNPQQRSADLKRIASAMAICDEVRTGLEDLSIPEANLTSLSDQLNGFNYFAETLDFELSDNDAKQSGRKNECLERLALLGKGVYERVLPYAEGIADEEQRKVFTEKLRNLAEAGNWAADRYHEANPTAPELGKVVLSNEQEPVKQEEQPMVLQNEISLAEQPVSVQQPQKEKAQAAPYNKAEMQQLLAWCDTVENLTRKHFSDKASVIQPAEFALLCVRRTINDALPHVDETGVWTGDKRDYSALDFKQRLSEDQDDLYEYSGEKYKDAFIRETCNNTREIKNDLVPIQNDLIKMFEAFTLENPGIGNDEMANDILQMNEALRGLMQYSKNTIKEYNKDIPDPNNRFEVPKIPARLEFKSDAEVGVNYGKLLDDNLKKKATAAMEAVEKVWNTLKKPDQPAPEPEVDPLDIYFKVERQSAKNKEATDDYCMKRATIVRSMDEEKREERIKQAKEEYKAELAQYNKYSREFFGAHEVVERSYEFARDMMASLKENKEIFDTPKGQMDLFGDMADKLADAVRGLQELKQNTMTNCSMTTQQQLSITDAMISLAKLSNYAATQYNQLAEESKLGIEPIPAVDLTPMETEIAQVKAAEQEEAARKVSAKKNQEERKKAAEQKKQAEKAASNIKKIHTTFEPKKGEEEVPFWPWDKLKKWLRTKEDEGHAKEYAEWIRGNVKEQQWDQFLGENHESLMDVAKSKNKDWDTFSQELKEKFMNYSDKEREAMGGVKMKMPEGLRDDAKQAGKKDKESKKKTGPVK